MISINVAFLEQWKTVGSNIIIICQIVKLSTVNCLNLILNSSFLQRLSSFHPTKTPLRQKVPA